MNPHPRCRHVIVWISRTTASLRTQSCCDGAASERKPYPSDQTDAPRDHLPHDLPPKGATYHSIAQCRTDKTIHDLPRWHLLEKQGHRPRRDPAGSPALLGRLARYG